MNRSRAYRRFQRKRAIYHKSMILRDYWKLNDADYWTPGRYGYLSKGKVHCSCWMCRRKSYDDPRIMDKRRTISQNQSLTAYETETEEVTGHGPLCSPEQTDEEAAESAPQRKAEHLGHGSPCDPDRGGQEGV